jgi:hypothetical protein
MKLQEKLLTVLFGLILTISGFVRFSQTKNYNFPFTYDQARDMLEIRALGEFKDLAVLGPTTSINGLRLGPFYYYINLPAYWAGGGNPQTLVNWNIILFLATAGFIFYFFRKKNIVLGFVVGSLFLTAPQMFNLTRYFWNANMATYLSVYFYLAVWNFLEKKDRKSMFWLGITSALLTQFEAAFGVVCILFAVLIIVVNKKLSWWKSFLIGLIPWFLPQIALEIKNRFQMTKLLLGMVSGQNQVLGEKLSFAETFLSHLDSFKNYFEGQFVLPFWGGLIVLVLAVGLILMFKKYRQYGVYFLYFLLFTFGFYLLIYRHPIKHWYLDGLRVWYCFMIGIALVNIEKYKNLTLILLVLVLMRNGYLAVKDQSKIIGKEESDNPKNLYNLVRNIDRVYSNTKDTGFEAYNYVPEIYDFSTQYLYWWYGSEKYGYMPSKVSYSLSQVPEYIRQQNSFYKNIRENKDGRIALIYETKSIYQEWLKQFDQYCIEDGWQAIWGTIVEVRKKCK